MTTTFELRDYQEDALRHIADAEHRGVRKQLVVAATGLGKTVMFTTLAQRRGGRALVLAHRDELIGQAAAKVLETWPDLTMTSACAAALAGLGRHDLIEHHPVGPAASSVGIVKAGADDCRAHVVIASVQTLARDKRLAGLIASWGDTALFGQSGRFELVIVDEAHHAAADSYRKVLDLLDAGGSLAEGAPLLVGFTATPERGDGQGLDGVFSEIVSNHDLLFGITAGYLSDVRGRRVTVTGFDVSELKRNRGDYDQGQAGRLLDAAGAPALIVLARQQYAAERPTIVFTPTVEVAHHVAAEFVGAGVHAAAIDASTPQDERRSILRDLKSGALDVVANCGVLTEGFDEPRVSCIVIARPTRSTGLYKQMIGRGTRRHPDKADCLVLDVVGASEDKDLVSLASLYGVKGKQRRGSLGNGSGTLSDVVIEDRREQVRVGQLQAHDVEMFEKVRHAGVAWVSAPDPRYPDCTQYRRSLDKGKADVVVLAQRHADGETWNAGILHPDGSKDVLVFDQPMEIAQGIAEDYIRKHAAHVGLVLADAKWRTKRPTRKQCDLAAKLKIEVDPAWTAGELSDRLDARMAQVKAKRQRTTAHS